MKDPVIKSTSCITPCTYSSGKGRTTCSDRNQNGGCLHKRQVLIEKKPKEHSRWEKCGMCLVLGDGYMSEIISSNSLHCPPKTCHFLVYET
jgi:hypothetical protein